MLSNVVLYFVAGAGLFVHCALFIEGRGWTASKSDLTLAFNTIRGYGY